jgi:N-acetylneuraminic acid mutarotase
MHLDSGVAEVNKETLMFAGGVELPSNLEISLVYLVSTDTLSARQAAVLPYPRSRLRLAVVGRSVYALGGVRQEGNKNDYSRNFTRYSSDRNAWMELTDMLVGVESPACCAQTDRLFVAGGCCIRGDKQELTDLLQVYDISTGSWSCLDVRMPQGLYNHSMAPLTEDSFIVFGGLDEDDEGVSRSYLLTLDGFAGHAEMPKGYNSSFTSYTKVYEGSLYTFSESFELFSYNFKSGLWTVFK